MGSKTSKAKRPSSYKRKTRNGTCPPPTASAIDPETSTTEHPTLAKPGAVIIPRVPHEIIDEIVDHLATKSDFPSLRACALVSKSWVPSCRRHLFHTIRFTSVNVHRWVNMFPALEESPIHHVRELRILIGGQFWVPERFFEYIPFFTNVESIWLLGYGGTPPLRTPSLWRLPQSVTSLTINSGVVTLVQVRDIMAQLPNLDDLSLMGAFVRTDRTALAGIGTVLKGRFGGQLVLRDESADKDVMNMLLEIPTGLRFTAVHIRRIGNCSLSTVRLVEACSETLVRLSYTAISHESTETFERAFDFSKCPNLQEVRFLFRAGRAGEGMFWIPMALSTLRPVTSPCLSTVRLDFARSLLVDRTVESLIEGTANDLRRVADEVARIEREFEGAVRLTTVRDTVFGKVLDTLKILQQSGR